MEGALEFHGLRVWSILAQGSRFLRVNRADFRVFEVKQSLLFTEIEKLAFETMLDESVKENAENDQRLLAKIEDFYSVSPFRVMAFFTSGFSGFCNF